MSPREPNLLSRLDPDAYMVEIAALLDILGIEHATVRLGVAQSRGSLFVQDLRTGQAARGVVRSCAGEALLPDHIEAALHTQLGIEVQLPGQAARAVARDLEVGRRVRLGLPVLGSAMVRSRARSG